MRASQALMLGSMLMKPLRGSFYEHRNGKDHGCALGMIVAGSKGIEAARFLHRDVFQWMNDLDHVPLPCDCTGHDYLMGSCGSHVHRMVCESSITSVVVHLFNQHVCDGTWTIERLADWLRTVEPCEELAVVEKTVEVEEVVCP